MRQVSEFNESLYRAFVSPWVKAAANPMLAEALYWSHPMRASKYVFSEKVSPWTAAFAGLAKAVSENRHALGDDDALIARERRLIEEVSALWEAGRRVRDAAAERAFTHIYGD